MNGSMRCVYVCIYYTYMNGSIMGPYMNTYIYE